MTEEICSECGRSVKPGSGNFVNRVPDCNTPEERKEMGRQYPEGDFVCAECDAKPDKEEYLEQCDHEWVSDGEVHIDCMGECLKKPVKCGRCGLLGDEVWMFSCYVDRNTGGMI